MHSKNTEGQNIWILKLIKVKKVLNFKINILISNRAKFAFHATFFREGVNCPNHDFKNTYLVKKRTFRKFKKLRKTNIILLKQTNFYLNALKIVLSIVFEKFKFCQMICFLFFLPLWMIAWQLVKSSPKTFQELRLKLTWDFEWKAIINSLKCFWDSSNKWNYFRSTGKYIARRYTLQG
jgi:hypothetical protein